MVIGMDVKQDIRTVFHTFCKFGSISLDGVGVEEVNEASGGYIHQK